MALTASTRYKIYHGIAIKCFMAVALLWDSSGMSVTPLQCMGVDESSAEGRAATLAHERTP